MCETNYFFDGDYAFVGWQFGRKYQEKMFWVTYLKTESSNVIVRKGLRKIAELSDQFSLTPHNFLQKLPTILTFL